MNNEHDPRWAAIIARDAKPDALFVYGVKTTGVYCRPSSASRLPRPENVEFFDTPAQAEAWLAEAPGVSLVNDALRNHYPMPNEASGQDDVLVGRIRSDLSDPSGRTLSIFVVGDQLLKGAALWCGLTEDYLR